MVAKSYQNWPVLSDVYEVNGRKYVKVRDKSGNPKQVRWYTEQEYDNMYKNNEGISTKNWNKIATKDSLGFKNGFITVFRGNTYPVRHWLKEHGALFSGIFNWYFPSDIDLPDAFPEEIEPVTLEWAAVLDPATGELGTPEYLKAMISAYIYKPSSSKYVGTLGERSEFLVHLDDVRTIQTQFGYSNLYNFHDEEDNVIKYFGTSVLPVEVGHNYVISAIVRDHSMYKNEKQTRIAYIKVKGEY